MGAIDMAIAANRFGLGARPGDLRQDGDVRAGLKAQVGRPQSFALEDPGLISSEQAGGVLVAYRDQRQAEKQAQAAAQARPAADMADMQGAPGRSPAAAQDQAAAFAKPLRELNQLTLADIQARYGRALTTDTSFAERLVTFWSNHFTVAATKLQTLPMAGPFEREVVRAHMTGSFADLLLASTRHPGMLLYLDQAQSIGPDSVAGQRRKAGLNENLAREIMELHTVGVHAGYTQADVTEFAKALTGWTIAGERMRRFAPNLTPGRFVFLDLAHEPGARTVLGRRYADNGEGQAHAILLDLARHPGTARHVATKLARHFVADDPPPEAVARLEKVFVATGGDLPSLHRAVVDEPLAWRPEASKFKTPYEFQVSALRLTGARTLPPRLIQLAGQMLGQPVFRAPSPAGWPDDAASWAGPDALIKRLEWSQQLADRSQIRTPPEVLAAQGLGASLTPRAATAIHRAESPAQGLVLALMSPEFQRR
jgi:uncharacterized protein (DUF1800 family)